MIDADLLSKQGEEPGFLDQVVALLSAAFDSYPIDAKRDFEILYCLRAGDTVPSAFRLWRIAFARDVRPRISEVTVPSKSGVAVVLGSGASSVRRHLERWTKSDVGGTSRAVFSAFCDSLHSQEDIGSGGPPQLVGLHRIGPAKTFGMVWTGRAFFYGTEVTNAKEGNLSWFNDTFEICDPVTLTRRADAQPQPKPKSV
jgi:hypothetical protein